jgi:alpha-beta hydrolase superfamily lysophospholipase
METGIMTESPDRSASQAFRHQSGWVSTPDGLELVWQGWVPEAPRGALVIVHGLAEHGGRYRETAEHFAAHGWAVYTGDLRAHGMSTDPSPGARVHVGRFTDYLLDVETFLGIARGHHPQLPTFLLGHSMGGLISILYALHRPDGLQGAIISSPALGTHPDFRPPLYLKLLVAALSHLAPRLLVRSELDTSAISRDPDVVRAYVDDPLVSEKVSARWYSEITRAMKKAHTGAASLRVPVLLMQSGADRLVDPAAPGRWAQEAPDERVDLVVWDGLYHEMFNEPEKGAVRSRSLRWLDRQTRPVTPAEPAG